MAEKNKANNLAVPELAEDAAERKRVLNVLAQRRYRQRRKERLRLLQSQLKNHGLGDKSSTETGSKAPAFRTSQTCDEAVNLDEPETGTAHNATETESVPSKGVNDIEDDDAELVIPSDQFDMSLFSPRRHQSGLVNDTLSFSAFDETWSQMEMFNLEHDHVPTDSFLDKLTDDAFSYDIDIPTELQTSEAATFTFPDDHLLKVPSLILLNAALQVAQRLNIADLIWDLGANSPFYEPNRPPDSSLSSSSSSSRISSLQTTHFKTTTDSSSAFVLPTNLRPTSSQIHIPHHPLLDLLPWPSTRDKLIQVFSLPLHLRPKSAQSPMGLVQLVQDMEDDGGEGVKVHGQDPCDACGWEIGQLLFEKWWWAFDTEVVFRSNQARKRRGEKALALQESQL